MFKRYEGNTGRVEIIPDAPPGPPPSPPWSPPPPPPPPPPGPLTGLRGLFSSLLPGQREAMETEDLLLLAILYLLYRESGDEEMLFILAAMVIL